MKCHPTKLIDSLLLQFFLYKKKKKKNKGKKIFDLIKREQQSSRVHLSSDAHDLLLMFFYVDNGTNKQ